MWQPEDAGPYVLDVALGVQWKVQSEESVDLCPFYSREIPIDFIEASRVASHEQPLNMHDNASIQDVQQNPSTEN